MPDELKLSDHCLVNHLDFPGPMPRITPLSMLRLGLMYADKLMHFTGPRGLIWRSLGVVRSAKNPNICNI